MNRNCLVEKRFFFRLIAWKFKRQLAPIPENSYDYEHNKYFSTDTFSEMLWKNNCCFRILFIEFKYYLLRNFARLKE